MIHRSSASDLRGTGSAHRLPAPESLDPPRKRANLNNDKTTTEKKPENEVKQEPAKKRPTIIEISDADLESVVGAGRCPPDSDVN